MLLSDKASPIATETIHESVAGRVFRAEFCDVLLSGLTKAGVRVIDLSFVAAEAVALLGPLIAVEVNLLAAGICLLRTRLQEKPGRAARAVAKAVNCQAIWF